MKFKLLTLALSLTLLLSLLHGCTNKEEPGKMEGTSDTSKTKTSVLQNQSKSFIMKYKLQKGKNYRYRLTTNEGENLEIQTKDTTIRNNVLQQIIYTIDFLVDRIDNRNTAEITCNFVSIKLDADANGKKFKYENGKTKNDEERKNFSQYESIINNPFGLRISQTGEIIELFRFEEIIEKFIDITGMRDSINAKVKENLRLSLTEATLKPLLSQIFRKLPGNQVAIDSAWSITQEPIQMASMTMKNTNHFKIASLEKSGADTIAVIEGDMRTEISGDQAVNDRGIQYFFEKPRASASGKIFFNLSQGRIQNSRTSTSMVSSFTAQASSPQGLMKQTQRKSSENSIIVEAL